MIGGIIHIGIGEFVNAFASYIGCCTNTKAEIRALIEDTLFCFAHSLHEIFVQFPPLVLI
jgi:hypothetical protein